MVYFKPSVLFSDDDDEDYEDDLEYDEFRPDLIDDADGDEEGGVIVFDPGELV